MDWLLDHRRDDANVTAVRALEDHLRRHTSDESSVAPAVKAAEATLRDLEAGTTGEDLLWVRLDWTRVLARLSVWRVDLRQVEPLLGETGVSPLGAVVAADLAGARRGDATKRNLAVPRPVVLNFDPDVGSLAHLDPLTDGPVSATVALAAAAESHPVATPDQVAAAAGALLGDAVMGTAATTGREDVAEAFLRVHEALGGRARRVPTDDDRLELAVDRTPFGTSGHQIPSLARVTEAIAGRIAARVNGKATVVQDESLAAGDPAGRLQIFFDDVEDVVCGSTYTWPPAGTHERADPSPRLEMSVSLPRQSHSVPVIRRLAAQILRAFGVAADHIYDVELAITEACSNVIQHAVDSEGYEVSIELASERCAITVLDRGDGFDATSVRPHAALDAEGGRGLTLMRALVDNLNFVSEPKLGAVVHMVKQLEYDQTHPFRHTSSA